MVGFDASCWIRRVSMKGVQVPADLFHWSEVLSEVVQPEPSELMKVLYLGERGASVEYDALR